LGNLVKFSYLSGVPMSSLADRPRDHLAALSRRRPQGGQMAFFTAKKGKIWHF
jgi:hypothetical protein